MMILASSSPRRKELLTQIGVRFKVAVEPVDETPLQGESPAAYVSRLALAKARAVSQKYPASVVLGADTTVVLHDAILAKPDDEAHAFRMLSQLSGQTHQVLTAVALVQGGVQRVECVATNVQFRPLTEAEIRTYVATGEPLDKAGAYGIQGKGAVLVAFIQGSYSNVVGLPLTETSALLNEFNVPIWTQE